ncbi:adipocyte plasma membrane-associated protein-like [Osmerus mordax]|uniref:adipocyte plasma membrane-associated protein-like n=1 Tax=Osmerus mordax TaxID=8014 RepID=UPI00350F8944
MLGKKPLSVVLIAVTVGVYLIPSPIDPEPHTLEGPPPALEGPLAVNNRLQKGRRLFTGKLHGPESFTADENGNVYTGTVDGKLWRIGQDDSLTLITHMGQDIPECGSSSDYEPVCGRPHGVRLDSQGQLIVADSYLGLHSVDPQNGHKTLLLSNAQGADGVPFAFLNGLDISSQTGTIYFTDSSSRWGRRHVKLEVRELDERGKK